MPRIGTEQTITSTYTSILTKNHEQYSPIYCEPTDDRYYEAIEMRVNESGLYAIQSSNNWNVGMLITIYKHHFYASIPNGYQYKEWQICPPVKTLDMVVELFSNIRYILVVTTCTPNITWRFSVGIFGRSSASLRRTSECCL